MMQNGNIIETIDALGHSSYFEYDAMNRLVKATLYRIDGRRSVNDAMGRLVSSVDAMGNVTGYAYDRNGKVIKTTEVTQLSRSK